jgi:hypothetical protein
VKAYRWAYFRVASGAHMRGGDTQRCRVSVIFGHDATLWAVMGVVPPVKPIIMPTRPRNCRRAILVPRILRSSKNVFRSCRGRYHRRNIAESPPHTPPCDPGQGKQVVFGFAATTQRNEVEMPVAQGWSKCSSRAYDLWGFSAASGGDCWAWLAERLLPQKRGTRLIRQAYA